MAHNNNLKGSGIHIDYNGNPISNIDYNKMKEAEKLAYFDYCDNWIELIENARIECKICKQARFQRHFKFYTIKFIPIAYGQQQRIISIKCQNCGLVFDYDENTLRAYLKELKRHELIDERGGK